jgi:hypothetical protein
VLDALKIIRPATLLRWHRGGFRTYWRQLGLAELAHVNVRAAVLSHRGALAEWSQGNRHLRRNRHRLAPTLEATSPSLPPKGKERLGEKWMDEQRRNLAELLSA